MNKKLLSVVPMKYMNIVMGIAAFTFSTLALISKDHYVVFGTLGAFVVIFLGLWKARYLRKHSKAKSK